MRMSYKKGKDVKKKQVQKLEVMNIEKDIKL